MRNFSSRSPSCDQRDSKRGLSPVDACGALAREVKNDSREEDTEGRFRLPGPPMNGIGERKIGATLTAGGATLFRHESR